jgi:hydrogenase expression/formation protein HypC
MCLAVPGKVVRWLDNDPICAAAEVEFGGITRRCHMACVREAQVGEYVVVHAGVAISQIDAVEAQKALAELASLPEIDDWPPAEIPRNQR